jgi:sulfur carrier protein
MAIVVRDGELLTSDRKLFHGDELLVRKVTSAG